MVVISEDAWVRQPTLTKKKEFESLKESLALELMLEDGDDH
jgi:hypothetical protein